MEEHGMESKLESIETKVAENKAEEVARIANVQEENAKNMEQISLRLSQLEEDNTLLKEAQKRVENSTLQGINATKQEIQSILKQTKPANLSHETSGSVEISTVPRKSSAADLFATRDAERQPEAAIVSMSIPDQISQEDGGNLLPPPILMMTMLSFLLGMVALVLTGVLPLRMSRTPASPRLFSVSLPALNTFLAFRLFAQHNFLAFRFRVVVANDLWWTSGRQQHLKPTERDFFDLHAAAVGNGLWASSVSSPWPACVSVLLNGVHTLAIRHARILNREMIMNV